MVNLLCLVGCACLSVGYCINSQVITLSNFGINENSYYRVDRLSKSQLSGNDLNLAGLSKTINSIPPSILTYTIKSNGENQDLLFDCEGNLTSLWTQYQKNCRDKGVKINYQELYNLWQKKDKFCSDLLGKISLKLFFNFITPVHSNYYLQKIIVHKLAYPGTRGNDEKRKWMSGFQRENGYQSVVLEPSLKNDTIILDKLLIIEKQGTLNVDFSSLHYEYLIPGSLQQGNYIIQLKFIFIDNFAKEHSANTPIFLVKI